MIKGTYSDINRRLIRFFRAGMASSWAKEKNSQPDTMLSKGTALKKKNKMVLLTQVAKGCANGSRPWKGVASELGKLP